MTFFRLFLPIGLLFIATKTFSQPIEKKGVLFVAPLESATDFFPSTPVITGNLSRIVFVFPDEKNAGITSEYFSFWLRRNLVSFRNQAVRLRGESITTGSTVWRGRKYAFVEITAEVTTFFGVNAVTSSLELSDDPEWTMAPGSVVNVQVRSVNMFEVRVLEAPVRKITTSSLILQLPGVDHANVIFTRKDGDDVLGTDKSISPFLDLAAQNGVLEVTGIIPGRYGIKVSSTGFITDSLAGVQVVDGMTAQVVLRLKQQRAPASESRIRNSINGVHVSFAGVRNSWIIDHLDLPPETGFGSGFDVSIGLFERLSFSAGKDQTDVPETPQRKAYTLNNQNLAAHLYLFNKSSRVRPFIGVTKSFFSAIEFGEGPIESSGTSVGYTGGLQIAIYGRLTFYISGVYSQITLNSYSVGNIAEPLPDMTATSLRIQSGLKLDIY